MLELTVNGEKKTTGAHRDTPLLYVLRNDFGLVGSRFGCGSGLCGACFVLADGRPIASCDLPIWSVEGKEITTVEGLGPHFGHGGELHPVQKALIAELRKFYYDTAQANHPGALAALMKLIPVPQVVFGTDFPFRRAAEELAGITNYGFSAADVRAIERENALRLLARA